MRRLAVFVWRYLMERVKVEAYSKVQRSLECDWQSNGEKFGCCEMSQRRALGPILSVKCGQCATGCEGPAESRLMHLSDKSSGSSTELVRLAD